MDSVNLLLTESVSPPSPLERLSKSAVDRASQEKKMRIARDFESILLTKLLDQMKNTIGDWGFEKDGSSGQVQGIFWLYLAQDIGNNGGTGLWKDIYQFLAGNEQAGAAVKSLGGRG